MESIDGDPVPGTPAVAAKEQLDRAAEIQHRLLQSRSRAHVVIRAWSGLVLAATTFVAMISIGSELSTPALVIPMLVISRLLTGTLVARGTMWSAGRIELVALVVGAAVLFALGGMRLFEVSYPRIIDVVALVIAIAGFAGVPLVRLRSSLGPPLVLSGVLRAPTRILTISLGMLVGLLCVVGLLPERLRVWVVLALMIAVFASFFVETRSWGYVTTGTLWSSLHWFAFGIAVLLMDAVIWMQVVGHPAAHWISLLTAIVATTIVTASSVLPRNVQRQL